MKKHLKKVVLVLLMLALVFSVLTACGEGSKGENGKSAYEIWLAEGNSGSESDFLDWLRGAAGNDGVSGQDGQDGATGTGEPGLSAYDIYMIHNPEYEGDEEQWIKDLASGKLARFVMTFDSTGGSEVSPIGNIKKNECVTAPPSPTKYREVFEGWHKDTDCTVLWDFDTDVVHDDITLYAKWRDAELNDLLQFTLIEGGTEYAVSQGTLYIAEDGTGTADIGDLVIPSEYKGLPVTAISDFGFQSGYVGYGAASIILPDSLKTIGRQAFAFSGFLKAIFIPKSVVRIDTWAFGQCNALESVIFEEGSNLQSMGSLIFHYCTSLETIELPASLREIEGPNFTFCSSLTRVDVDSNNPYFLSDQNCIIRKSDNFVIDGCIADGIPEYIKGIGERGFFSNKKLIDISIPNGVTEIGKRAFAACSNLVNVIIPEGVKVLEDMLFQLCNKIEMLRIPSTIKTIGEYVIGSDSTVVLYSGTSINDWNKINISELRNETLQNAPRYYYSNTKPTEGNYWRFVDGVPEIWDINANYFEVRYSTTAFADDKPLIRGDLQGEKRQLVKEGNSSLPVLAVPRPGYKFVCWVVAYGDAPYSRGEYEGTPALRQDINVTQNINASAIFFREDWKFFSDGDGTAENPFLISSTNHMYSMRYFPNAHYKLIADIDFCNVTEFTPLFGKTNMFEGVFDGNGKTISNLTVDSPYYANPSLFGIIGENGVVKNLKMTGADITVPKKFAPLNITLSEPEKDHGIFNVRGTIVSAGAVAGMCLGELSNINVSGTIRASGLDYDGVAIGGLAGRTGEREIKNCHTDIEIIIDDITVTNHIDSFIAGGLVGGAFGDIIDCSAAGSITLTKGGDNENIGRHLGGLVGQYYYHADNDSAANVTISDSFSDVKIKSDSNSVVGGFIAMIASYHDKEQTMVFTITDCYAAGDIDAYYRIGGFIGDFYVDTGSSLTNCYSTGNVLSRGDKTTGNTEYDQAAGFICRANISVGVGTGGVITREKISLTNCYSTGDVTANCMAAGFVVYGFGMYLNDCFVTGNITAQRSASGFADTLYHINDTGKGKITNCYVSGDVTGSSAVGFASSIAYCEVSRCYVTGNVVGQGVASGFVESVNDAYIKECFTTGDVTGSSATGFADHVFRGTITDCYALGDIYALGTVEWWRDIGGFVGTTSYATIKNCYAAGKIFPGTDMDESWLRMGGFGSNLSSSTITNCHWLYYADGATDVSAERDTSVGGAGITKHSDTSTFYTLADILNGDSETPVWINVAGRPPQLSFMVE